MTRGFDHFNRFFTFHDPPTKRGRGAQRFTPQEEAYFAPVSATYLRWSRWFQLDDVHYADDTRPQITIGAGTVTATSPVGIPWVGFWVGPDIYSFRAYPEGEPPTKIELSREEIEKLLDGKRLSAVTAIATNGRGGRANRRR